MSEVFFRKQDIIVKDKAITIEQKSIEDVFKFDSQPYIIVGASGGGKTTLCIDIMYKFSKQCTNIYYITSTKESIKDDTISQIPRAFRRRPTFENLNNIWREIVESHDAAEANEQKLTKILVNLCGQNEAQQILRTLEEKRRQIQQEQHKYYTSNNDSENDALEKAKNDSKAFYIDTLSKLILDFASSKGTRKLTSEDMMILSALVSPYPRVLLLMDDVSAELNDLKTKSTKVMYNGQPTKISDAYKNLIIDILTRGRHYGALVCLFLHTIDLITDKSLINNLVILNKEAAQKVCNARSFPDEMRTTLNAVAPVIFTIDHKYCFLYINQSNDIIGVGKADLHYGQPIQLSKVNAEYIKAVENIYAGIDANGLGGMTTMIDDNEDSYDSEYATGSDEEVGDFKLDG